MNKFDAPSTQHGAAITAGTDIDQSPVGIQGVSPSSRMPETRRHFRRQGGPVNKGLVGVISVVAVILICGCTANSVTAPGATPSSSTASTMSEPRLFTGLAYGPFHAGQDPNKAIYPSAREVAADIPTLAALTNKIRIYGSQGPASDIVRAAEASHLAVDLGIWLGSDADANEREIAAGIKLMSSDAVSTVTVGNEALLSGALSEAQLRATIGRVRAAAAALPHRVLVTTADTRDMWLTHPDIASDVDLITINLYPFWERVPIDTATQSLDQSYARVKNAFPGKTVVIGETGWPSEGPAQGAAIANTDNQSRYLREFLDWAKRQNSPVDYYYFEAFDELWKTNESGVGTHWGLYDEQGALKRGLRGTLPEAFPETLSQRSHPVATIGTATTRPQPNTPTATPTPPLPTPSPSAMRTTGTPKITFATVPPIGSSANLTGRVTNLDPKLYRVVVFIKVSGTWWVKPYWASPMTTIAADGTWTCDIVTGGHDEDATAIEAFIVHHDIQLPSTPTYSDVQPHAVAHVYKSRR